MPIVKFRDCGSGGWVLKFNYDAEIVELIKAVVPHAARSYNAKEKLWAVDDEYAAELAADLGSLGHSVIGFSDPC